MHTKIILKTLGVVSGVEALLLLFPYLVSIIYAESSGIHFLIWSLVLGFLYLISCIIKTDRKHHHIYARDGFIIVSVSWLLLSFFGALPLVTSGAIPSFVDAFFEVVSGFTTTGSSILREVESLPHCVLFWRSFTHWIGGMGVLVFILSIIKMSGNDHNMHLMRAESPGPMVEKLLPKLKQTATTLYVIYTVMTLILILLLVFAGMPLFDALCNAFGTAGTGGFGILNAGIGQYNNVVYEVILTVFMILFGINFNFYFFLLIWDIKSMFKMAEVKGYFLVILVSVGLITLNLIPYYDSLLTALRHSTFQVASIITTTGFSSTDFNLWPQFSKTILFILMFVGACAGSTGGGVKISRYVIIFQKIKHTIHKMIHPRSINVVSIDGKQVEDDVVNEVFVFFALYMLIFAGCLLIVSLDGFDFETTISSVATCLGNVGPGFSLVGPLGNFADYSNGSKIVLSFAMLFGRLELFPMLLTFLPMSYRDTKIFK